MKLTGVASGRKWLQTPWVVSLWSFLLQGAAGTDILFEFKKGQDRLMEDKLIEDCHVQRWDICLGKSEVRHCRKPREYSEGKKIEEICLNIYYTSGNYPVLIQKRLAVSLSLFCSIALVCSLAKNVLGNNSLRWIWCFSSDCLCPLTLSVLCQHSGILLRYKPEFVLSSSPGLYCRHGHRRDRVHCCFSVSPKLVM